MKNYLCGFVLCALCMAAGPTGARGEALEQLEVTGATLEGAYYGITLGSADLVSNCACTVNASLVKIYRAHAGVSNFTIAATLLANTGPRVAQGPHSSQAVILYAWNTERSGQSGPPDTAPTANYTLGYNEASMARVDLRGIGSGNFHQLPCFLVFLRPPTLVKSYWTFAGQGRLDYMIAYADGLNPFAQIKSVRLDGVALTKIPGDWDTPTTNIPPGSYIMMDPQEQAFAVNRDHWGFDEIRKFIRCYDWGYTRPSFRVRFPANLSDGPHTLSVVATPFNAADVDCFYNGKACAANVKGVENHNVALEFQSGNTNYIWYGAADLGGGWKWLDWIGYFIAAGPNWIWHSQHGWMYGAGSPSDAWLWTGDMGWLWTRNTSYPYLYRQADRAWLWYMVDSSNPRWFLNLTALAWEAH